MNTSPRLIIVCGLPGSGKTTRAKQLEVQRKAIRMCPDEWMNTLEINLHDEDMREKIEALQWKLVQNILRLGLNVIIEWGTWARVERDTLRKGARALGALVELHYLSASPDELFDRIQRRGQEDPPIEREAIDRWYEFFQEPTPEEMLLFDEATAVAPRGFTFATSPYENKIPIPPPTTNIVVPDFDRKSLDGSDVRTYTLSR